MTINYSSKFLTVYKEDKLLIPIKLKVKQYLPHFVENHQNVSFYFYFSFYAIDTVL